jgi:hypothetical protein
MESNHRYLHIRQVSCHWTNLRKSPRECLEVASRGGRESIALWSAWQGSNLRHSVCKTDTRTTELHAVGLEVVLPRVMVEKVGFEPTTFAVQKRCSPVELQSHLGLN